MAIGSYIHKKTWFLGHSRRMSYSNREESFPPSASVSGAAEPRCVTGFSAGAAASSCQPLSFLSGGATWSMALWHPRTEKTLDWCCDLKLVWLGQCQKRGRRKGKIKNVPEIVRLWQFQGTKSFNLPSWASQHISYFPSEICFLISLSHILLLSIPSSKWKYLDLARLSINPHYTLASPRATLLAVYQ